MPSMIIGGNAFTTELEVCTYVFKRHNYVEINGLGEAVTAGYPEVTITYSSLIQSDFVWWASTICANLPSKTHTSATLYTDQGATAAYTNAVVFYPTYDGILGQWYQNVVIRITQLQ